MYARRVMNGACAVMWTYDRSHVRMLTTTPAQLPGIRRAHKYAQPYARPAQKYIRLLVSPSEARYFCRAMAPPKVGKEKKRKRNYNSEEMAILLAALTKYDAYLHGAQSANTTKAQRREILAKIALDVNVIGNDTRTSDDIQKKLNDMRRRVQDKLALMKKHARGTGGGPA